VSLLDRAIVRLLPAVPRRVVRRLWAPYIAGATLADAVRTVERLNPGGKLATIDVLGEEITRGEEAAAIVAEYEDVFTEIEQRGLEANVSVKLTALGLGLGYDVCRANLEHVVAHAAASGNFVRIDMEDSSTTDDTLALYRELRDAGHDNVGVVLQASLLVRHAPSYVSDAFCASRLGGDWGIAFGTLPRGLDLRAIVDRAAPVLR